MALAYQLWLQEQHFLRYEYLLYNFAYQIINLLPLVFFIGFFWSYINKKLKKDAEYIYKIIKCYLLLMGGILIFYPLAFADFYFSLIVAIIFVIFIAFYRKFYV